MEVSVSTRTTFRNTAEVLVDVLVILATSDIALVAILVLLLLVKFGRSHRAYPDSDRVLLKLALGPWVDCSYFGTWLAMVESLVLYDTIKNSYLRLAII